MVHGVTKGWTQLKWLSKAKQIFHSMYTSHLAYPLTHWGTFALFALFGCCEWRGCVCGCTDIFLSSCFRSFVSIARSGITGHVVILCCRFNKCHTVSHSSCIILHCHQQRTRVPVSPHPCQRMLFSGFFFFFTIVMVVDINWCPGSFGEGNGNPFQCSCLEKSHGRRSLVSCSPWGRRESDMTEQLNWKELFTL